MANGQVNPTLFDRRDLAEISSDLFPGERLVVCFNPRLEAERRRKREDLLRSTEKKLEAVAAATRRERRPLRGTERIGRRVGAVIGKFKMAKHFLSETTDTSFTYRRNQESISAEQALDGLYLVRTNAEPALLSTDETVRTYKSLSAAERAFRSMKSVDIRVRPIFHRKPERVRAHVFLCMLAYYGEWHLRKALAPSSSKTTSPKPATRNAPPRWSPPGAPPKPAARSPPARPPRGSPSTTSEPCSRTWEPSPSTPSAPR